MESCPQSVGDLLREEFHLWEERLRRNYRVEADRYRARKAEERALEKLKAADQERLANLQAMYDDTRDPDWLKDKALFEFEMSKQPSERGAFPRLLKEARSEIDRSFADGSWQDEGWSRPGSQETGEAGVRLMPRDDDNNNGFARPRWPGIPPRNTAPPSAGTIPFGR